MKMSKGEYRKFAGKSMPKSDVKRNVLKAFVSGGAICAAGQGILNIFLSLGLEKDAAATACSITLVLIGALLTGLGVYDDMAAFAGAGTLVPITGFSNSVAAAAIEFKSEGLITGTAVKMFSIAGPVLVYGVSASVLYGIALYMIG